MDSKLVIRMTDPLNITSLADAGAIATQALNTIITSTIAALPAILAAVIIFLLGWVIAIIVSKILEKILKFIKLEEFLEVHKLEDAFGSVKLSNIFVKVVKIYIILVFVQVSVSLLSLGELSKFLNALLLYAPVLIGAILVVVAAVLVGEYVKEKVLELGKTPYVVFFARASKFVLILIGVLTGLNTAGFDTSLLNNIIIDIIRAVVFGLSVAFGIAFGLGGQKDAQEIISKVRKHVKI